MGSSGGGEVDGDGEDIVDLGGGPGEGGGDDGEAAGNALDCSEEEKGEGEDTSSGEGHADGGATVLVVAGLVAVLEGFSGEVGCGAVGGGGGSVEGAGVEEEDVLFGVVVVGKHSAVFTDIDAGGSAFVEDVTRDFGAGCFAGGGGGEATGGDGADAGAGEKGGDERHREEEDGELEEHAMNGYGGASLGAI